MYKITEIINPDGSKTINATRINQPKTKMTDQQVQMERAIKAFGTSS